MNIHESAEDYLERILMLQQKLGHVRAIDIANDMNFSRASVSHAMKLLKEDGYIEVDDDSNIILLTKGREIAENILHRHRLLTDLFISMGVSSSIAEQDACKIEHDLSQETFDAIARSLDSFKK